MLATVNKTFSPSRDGRVGGEIPAPSVWPKQVKIDMRTQGPSPDRSLSPTKLAFQPLPSSNTFNKFLSLFYPSILHTPQPFLLHLLTTFYCPRPPRTFTTTTIIYLRGSSTKMFSPFRRSAPTSTAAGSAVSGNKPKPKGVYNGMAILPRLMELSPRKSR